MKKVLKLRLMSDQMLNYSQAEKDLRLWGKFLRPLMYSRNAYYNRQAQCILPKIVMYGLHQPSGFYESHDQIDNYTISQIQRVFHFLPTDELKAVTIQKYIFDGEERFKARRLGMSHHAFRGNLTKAIEFFVQYRNVNFS